MDLRHVLTRVASGRGPEVEVGGERCRDPLQPYLALPEGAPGGIERLAGSEQARGHSGRGRQQKRFTHSVPYSGNEWHARWDSVSTVIPVMPPESGN